LKQKEQSDFMINRILRQNGLANDVIDLQAEKDSTLSAKENAENITEQYGLKQPKQISDYEYRQMQEEAKALYELSWTKILERTKTIGIAGGQGSGKTALCFYISQFTTKPKYIYRFPKPELLPTFKILFSFGELSRLNDSFIIIDEIGLFIDISDKEMRQAWLKLMSLMRQKNNTIVISTSDTRFYTMAVESYVDAWCVLDIDIDTVKRGGKIGKLIERNSPITTDNFNLPFGNYIFECRQFPEYNKIHIFDLPNIWVEDISKAYKYV